MMQAIDRYSDVFGKSVNNTDGFETANIGKKRITLHEIRPLISLEREVL